MSNMVLFGVIENWISNWLTPIWLIGLGAIGGFLLIAAAWGVAFLLSRIPSLGRIDERKGLAGTILRAGLGIFSQRAVREIPTAVREGVLLPLFVTASVLAVFGIVGVIVVQKPGAMLQSLARLPAAGTRVERRTVDISDRVDPNDPYSELTEHEVPLSFAVEELQRLVFRSDQNLEVSLVPFAKTTPELTFEVLRGEAKTWYKTQSFSNPFDADRVANIYVRNSGDAPADLTITILTGPPYPEVATVVFTAVGMFFIFLVYVLQRTIAPRLSAIALATYKSEIAQPLFLLLLLLGALALYAFIFIPYNTFGEDIKMLKDTGMTLVMVVGIIQAIWAASTSVSEEIEGRTALTVLSKPVGRRSFIIGKYLGILWTVAVLFILLGLVLVIATAYKPIYDARESSTQDVTWQICHAEMLQVVAGLVLGFIEAAILAAISVAISTRLPLLANFVICLSIYFLGHLTPLIAQSSMGQFVIVKFFGQLIATVFPVLDHYSIQAAIAGGSHVPYTYLFWAAMYGLIYSTIAMLLALVLFEDRDLA